MSDNNQINENSQSYDNGTVDKNNISASDCEQDCSPHKTYGAIYSPDDKNNEYSCERYSMNSSACNIESDGSRERITKSKSRNKTAALTVICIVMFIAVILTSSVAAFGITLYLNYSNGEEESSGVDNEQYFTPNNVYIDTSAPKYTAVDLAPGSLLSMEEAIATVKDSVVEITTETVNSGLGGFSQYVVSGAGSGVIISDGGYIITNHHVIDGASNIKVRLTDGSEYTATLIGADKSTDVAVISIMPEEGKTLKTAVIGSSESLRLGQTVIAIGNPLGQLGGTVTDGIISSLAREIQMEGGTTMTLLQTNAAVSPGNSGGGLFDLYGRLIGVVNAKSTGEGIEGISFAIPINTAWDIAQQLINNGYIAGRPTLPLTLEEIRYGYGYFGQSYYQVQIVSAPADSDLRAGDVIEAIDGISVSTLSDISEIIASHKIGDVISVIVSRNHKYVEAQLEIVEYIPD